MASKRRYKNIKESEKVYHEQFDNLRMQSIVLNINARRKSERAINFHNRSDLKKLLAEFQEKQNQTNTQLAAIPDKLKEKSEQDKAVGKASKPNQLLLAEQLRTEAACDVLKEEIAELNKLIGDVGEAAEKRSKCLEHGPRGHGIIKANRLVILDGQRIADIEGKLCIVDPRSIYDKISVEVYYEKIMKPWKIASGRLIAEKLKLEKMCIKEGSQDTFTERWEERKKQIFQDNPEWQKLFSITNIEGAPAMPDPALAKIKA